jgi:transcriptional regulator with XRE-family HTH domain
MSMTPLDLKSARLVLGLSQQAMAALIGIRDGGTIKRYEGGQREIPGPVAVLVDSLMAVPELRRHLGL